MNFYTAEQSWVNQGYRKTFTIKKVEKYTVLNQVFLVEKNYS